MEQDEQKTLWSGPAGSAWIDMQETLDRLFAPFVDMLVEGSGSVLDVGCGTGATTIAAARHDARCVGIDISAPMLEVARARAATEGVAAHFILGDAQTYAFEPFDRIISRFGVMFFADPIAAFANLRRAGRALRFVAWRRPEENPFMTAAERAASPLLPEIPPRRLDAPGQFAFAEERRVRGILEASGWNAIAIEPVDVPCTLAKDDLVRYVSQLGPVGRVLREADEASRKKVIEAVCPAFDPYVHGAEVCFTAACWLVEAKR